MFKNICKIALEINNRPWIDYSRQYGTQQCINSVKKIWFSKMFSGICMAALGNKFSKSRTILDKNIETFIKIGQIWKHTPPSVNRLTAVTKNFEPYQKIS